MESASGWPESAEEAAAAPAPAPAAVPTIPPIIDPTKLTQEQRRAQICLFLSKNLTPNPKGIIAKGAVDEAMERFQCKRSLILNVWRRYKSEIMNPDKYTLDVRRRGKSGRKKKWTPEFVRDTVKNVPAEHRQSIRLLEKKTGIPKATLSRYLKAGDFLQRSEEDGSIIVREDYNASGDGENVEQEEGGAVHTHQQQLAAAAAAGGTQQTITLIQNEMQLNKLRQQMTQQFQKEKDEAIKRTKAEMKRKHKTKTSELRTELDYQKDLQSKKDKAILALRLEMHRHQLEMEKLKGELDRIQYGEKIEVDKKKRGRGRPKKGEQSDEESC